MTMTGHEDIIGSLAEALHEEWPNCFSDGFQHAVAQIAVEHITALSDDAARAATAPPEPRSSEDTPLERQFEGYVKYADDTVVCLQCFEGRHGECPAEVTPDLDGYYCECSDPAHPEGPDDPDDR
jgi:hypothetical protein